MRPDSSEAWQAEGIGITADVSEDNVIRLGPDPEREGPYFDIRGRLAPDEVIAIDAETGEATISLDPDVHVLVNEGLIAPDTESNGHGEKALKLVAAVYNPLTNGLTRDDDGGSMDLPSYVDRVQDSMDEYTYAGCIAAVQTMRTTDIDKTGVYVKLLQDVGGLPEPVVHNMLASLLLGCIEQIKDEPDVEEQLARYFEDKSPGS